MKKLIFALVAAAAFLMPGSGAQAADLDIPPPEHMRPATFDWTGPYLGINGAAIAVDGTFDGVCSCGSTYDDFEHSGIGWAWGGLVGFNYQLSSIVLGLEGDWGMGGTVATNDEPGIDTDLSFNQIATFRARLGMAHENTMVYLTGGAAAVEAEFGAVMASTENDRAWVYGWTVGGGVEHAFTDNFRGRIEYLYIDLPDIDFSMTDSAATTLDVTQSFNNVHMVRAGFTYNFTW